MNNIFSISNKVIVVSGAYGNIGKTLLENLATNGAQIAAFDIPQAKEKLDSFSQALQEKYAVKIITYAADVTDDSNIESLSAQIMQDFGKIDGLVTCAGINHHADMFSYSYEDFANVLNVNVAGTYICCKHFAKYMIQAKQGSIVNFGSMSGHVINIPPKVMVPYNTSKAAVIHMSKALASELGKYNVRCNSVSPGLMESGMSNIKGFNPAEKDYLNKLYSLTPLQRPIKMQELMGSIIYLLSDAATATTGADIIVDGGYTIW